MKYEKLITELVKLVKKPNSDGKTLYKAILAVNKACSTKNKRDMQLLPRLNILLLQIIEREKIQVVKRKKKISPSSVISNPEITRPIQIQDECEPTKSTKPTKINNKQDKQALQSVAFFVQIYPYCQILEMT